MNQNGKTIKQIADGIGVSKQAVFKKIKKEPLSTSLQRFMQTVDGTVYISVDGETLVKSAFDKQQSSTVDDNKATTSDNQVYDMLKTTIEVLQEQLKVKDTQIADLTAALEKSQEFALNAQQTASAAQALHAGTIQQLITDGAVIDEVKPTFKERLKYLFKGER